MNHLIRMDLYRMVKARSFKVCLVLAFLFGFIGMPLLRLLTMIMKFIPGSDSVSGIIPESVMISSLFSNMFPALNCMILLFSACYFFYADLEHGYIKNIAGQMPKKGYTVLSKFCAVIPHNLILITAGIVGNIVGHALTVRLVADSDILKTLGFMLIRFLLLQGLCAILLLVTASLHSKTFGMVLCVGIGTGMMNLIYKGIDAGVLLALKKSVSIENYMPDQLLWDQAPKLIPSLPVAAVVMILFLLLAVWLFNKRDVK